MNMSKKSKWLILAFALLSAILYANDGESVRKALVIGNGAYSATPLKNPVNDARDMAGVLRKLGFEVTVLLDARSAAMMSGIQRFSEELKPGDNALFYYSGHGFQLRGTNYLIPIDNDIVSIEEVAYKAPSVDYILSKLEAGKTSTNIIILDACRNNPFPGSDRSGWRGLANVDYPVSGTIVVYATAPGSVAADGSGRNGIFTRSLIGHMREPGKDIESVLRLVRDDVIGETAGLQIPWSNSSLRGDGFFFAGTGPRDSGSSAGTISYQEPEDMVFVQGGDFLMGYDNADSDERPVHRVSVRDFYIASYETTYEEYDEYCTTTGRPLAKDAGTGRSRHPVSFVTWYDAVCYCNWRSEKEHLPPFYEIVFDESGSPVTVGVREGSTGYRLPTEAEWEYSARGGPFQSSYRNAGGDDLNEIAVWKENSAGQTWVGGSRKPNALEVFDMAGNVWEWCYDWYAPYEKNSSPDTCGPSTGTARILRGGGYNTATVAYYSVSNRGSSAPSRMGSDIGFRLVRSAR